MPNNYSKSHQSDKRNHSYAQKNKGNSKEIQGNRERKARQDIKNLPGQNKFEDWQQKASRENERQEKPSLRVVDEMFLRKIIEARIIENQTAEKIAAQNQPHINAKENQKNKQGVKEKKNLREDSRSGLPRNSAPLRRAPVKSPQISPYLVTALIVMTLIGIAAGMPSTNTNSSRNNGRDGKSNKIKPFVGDFSDAQGKPIINQKAPILPKLFEVPVKGSEPVFQSVSEPAHLIECAKLILNAKAAAPNLSSQKAVTQSSDIVSKAKVREIQCVRLREPSDAEAISVAAQEADKALDSGDRSLRDEIINSFAMRESAQVAFGGQIKKNPLAKTFLDEYLTSKKHLSEKCEVDYDIQNEAHRVDAILSGSEEITPTYTSKSLRGAEFSINYNYNNPLLRELQYNLVVACDNLALEKIARLVNRRVMVPSISLMSLKSVSPISLLNFFALSNTDEAIKAAEILLAQDGVSPDGASLDDFPLALATTLGNVKLVRLLLANKANPYGQIPQNVGKYSGKTLLDLAFDSGNEELLKIFLVENNLFPLDQLTIKQLEHLIEKQILATEAKDLIIEKEDLLGEKIEAKIFEGLNLLTLIDADYESLNSLAGDLERLKVARNIEEQIPSVKEKFDKAREMMKSLSQKTQQQLTNNEQELEQKLQHYQDTVKNIIVVYESNLKTNQRGNLLSVLVGNHQIEAAKIAIQSGVDVNGVDEKDCPLHAAALHGDVAFMELLIAHGANPHKQMPKGPDLIRGYNIFDAALESGEVAPLKFIFKNPYFSLNVDEVNLATSLLMTKGQITAEQLRYLVQEADLDINDMYDAHHILCITAIYAYNDATRAILALGEDHLVNTPSKSKMYPLHLAIGKFGVINENLMSVSKNQEYNQRYESVLLLMNASANLFALDAFGRTAKDIAEEKNLPEITALLEKAMKKDSRYPEYLAQSINKKFFNNLLTNNRIQGFLVGLVLVIAYVLHYINIVLPPRGVVAAEEEMARARIEREQRANAERDEARQKAEAEAQARAQARIQAEQQIRLHTEELERKRVKDAEAQRKAGLQNKLNTISDAKKALDKQVEGFKKRRASFKLKADNREMFPQGLRALINDKLAKLQGEQYKLADKINVKKNEIEAALEFFEDNLRNYDLKIESYDEKNGICQKELTLNNIEALKVVELELKDIIKNLQELEKNINQEKERADVLIKKFAQVCQQEPAPPAAAAVSGKDEERRFRFDPKAEKDREPKPKDPSSSKSTAQEEKKAKVLKPAAVVATQPKNEPQYRKPAAAGAPFRSVAEPKDEQASLSKAAVQPLAPIAVFAKEFPPSAVKLSGLPVQPAASHPAPKQPEPTPTMALAMRFPPSVMLTQATPPLEGAFKSIPTTSTDEDLVMAEENSPRLEP